MGVGLAVVDTRGPCQRALVGRLQAQFLCRDFLRHVLPIGAAGCGLGHDQRPERRAGKNRRQLGRVVDPSIDVAGGADQSHLPQVGIHYQIE